MRKKRFRLKSLIRWRLARYCFLTDFDVHLIPLITGVRFQIVTPRLPDLDYHCAYLCSVLVGQRKPVPWQASYFTCRFAGTHRIVIPRTEVRRQICRALPVKKCSDLEPFRNGGSQGNHVGRFCFWHLPVDCNSAASCLDSEEVSSIPNIRSL